MSVVVAETLGATRLLTLNRPDKRNAADLAMQRTLLAELKEAAGDTALRALVLTGAGEAFSAGGDRDILAQIAAGACAEREELGRINIETIRTMLALEIPAIAAVNGFAIGYAAGLVALCDWVVMGEGAFLSDPHVRYGIAAGPATQLLWPRRCPELLARDTLMTGRRVCAEEALRIGLCSRICPDGEELAVALELAESLAALPPAGIAATKRAFNAPLAALVAEFERDGMQSGA